MGGKPKRSLSLLISNMYSQANNEVSAFKAFLKINPILVKRRDFRMPSSGTGFKINEKLEVGYNNHPLFVYGSGKRLP